MYVGLAELTRGPSLTIKFLAVGQNSRRLFRPFPFPVEEGIIWRAKSSNITLWTMFIGAKITEAMLDGTSLKQYPDWINRFHGQLLVTSEEPSISDLTARLSGLQDVSCFKIHCCCYAGIPDVIVW
jgi:hypothetical protein